MSLYLAQAIPQNIIGYIQTNIDAALAAEIATWPDGIVSLYEPAQYYFYEDANPPQCPALYVLNDRIDYQLDKKMANHINAIAYVRCGMIVEDVLAENATRSTYRYANVLHKILNETQIDYVVSGNTVVKDVIKITATSFSGTFKKNASPDSQDGPFRNEFVHELQVEHYENFS